MQTNSISLKPIQLDFILLLMQKIISAMETHLHMAMELGPSTEILKIFNTAYQAKHLNPKKKVFKKTLMEH